MDRNGNGAIDDGTELFGTATPLFGGGPGLNGYAALAEFDAVARGGNADGVISSDDDIWNRLVLWTDRNHDGVSEADELSSLTSRGVVQVDFDYVESKHRDRHGNRFRYKSQVVVLNPAGRERVNAAYDVFFRLGD